MDFSAVQVPRNGFQKRFGFQLLLWIRNIRMSIKIEKSNVGNADLETFIKFFTYLVGTFFDIMIALHVYYQVLLVM